jgi:hypothetical protein
VQMVRVAGLFSSVAGLQVESSIYFRGSLVMRFWKSGIAGRDILRLRAERGRFY